MAKGYGHQPQPVARPGTPPSGGSSVKGPAQASAGSPELPNFLAPAPQPTIVRLTSVGDIVLVKTAAPIAGRSEHAAIVTSVHGGEAGSEVLDVLLMPRGTDPYPVLGINPAAAATSLFWRPRE